MTLLLILLAVLTALALVLLRLIDSDDRGHRPPPASHPVDRRFLPPTAHL